MNPDLAHRLHDLFRARRSARVPFDPRRPVTEAELVALVEAARWAPTAHNMQNFRLVVVDDRDVLAELGRIRAPISAEFIVENFHQLAWSCEELARKQVGILGTQFPASWRTDDPARVPHDASRLLADVIAGAPTVIVVVYDSAIRAPASEHDALGLVSLGCVLENMWLAAAAAGLDVQVASAFADGAEADVARTLAIPPPWRIAFALRVGHAIGAIDQPRVRRAHATIVGRNHF